MNLIVLLNLAISILILVYSFCSYGNETTYRINIHIFNRSSLEPLIYRAVHQVSASSNISRVNMSFHSNTDIEKGTETFALDHCLNPHEKSPRKILFTLSFRANVKDSEKSCLANDFFNLNMLVRIIMSDVVYIRLTQHSDRKKMHDEGNYIFHSDFKYGVPTKPKELKSGIKMFKTKTHKNFPSRLNRWFAHSSVNTYIHAKSTMKFIENSDYHDFLLGSSCSFGIIEVSIFNPATGMSNAGLLFYNFFSSEVLLIEIQSRHHSDIYSTETSVSDTAHNNSNPDTENEKQACRVGLTNYRFTK